MHTLEEIIPLLERKSGGWTLVVGPSSLNTPLLQSIAHFLLPGLPVPASQAQVQADAPAGVHVLDGGNRFNAFSVARAARGRPEVLNRITVSRAFTCYQVRSLLESTPAGAGPFVILDLLRTFYDESVQAGERKRLLQACLTQLRRLEQAGGGLVSVHPPALASPAALELLALLQLAAAETFFFQEEPKAPIAPRLFQ